MENLENNSLIIEQNGKNSFQLTASPLFSEDDLFATDLIGNTLPKIDELSIDMSLAEENRDYSLFPQTVGDFGNPNLGQSPYLDFEASSASDRLTGALVEDDSVRLYQGKEGFGDNYKAGVEQSSQEIFYRGLEQAVASLLKLNNKDNFDSIINRSFGGELDLDLVRGEISKITNGEAEIKFELVSQAQLGAKGGYAKSNNTIFLAEEFLEHNDRQLDAVAEVILEEIGHYLDRRLNETDTNGDEAAKIAPLSLGKEIAPQQLSAIEQENDSATIIFDDRILEIEQSEDINLSSGTANISGTLQENDSLHPNNTGKYHDDYQLTGISVGDNLTINLTSSGFDAYLELINADTGEVIANNDDGGEGRNSRLFFTTEPDVKYLVRATSFSAGQTGNYELNLEITYLPDLDLVDFKIPPSASVNETIPISWTVNNLEDASTFNNWSDVVYLSVDLALNTNDIVVTDSAKVNETIPIEWTIKNQGNTPVINKTVNTIYLSEDETLGDDIELEKENISDSELISLGKEGQYTLNTDITLPNIEPGLHHLLFVLDDDENQKENDESNNVVAVAIEVKPVDANLGIISADAPETVSLGEEIDLSWRVKNSGSEAANGDWYDRIYFSEDEIFDEDTDRELISEEFSTEKPLAAGRSYSRKVSRAVTYSLSDLGSRYLFFVTDGDNEQGESNETDNVTGVPIKVVAPDLTIKADALSAPIYSNSNNIPLSWTVTNLGNGTAVSDDLYDYVYLSTDKVYDDEDSQIASFNPDNHLPLALEEDYTAEAKGSIGDVAPGNYNLLFVTDRNGTQGETDETNNITSVPVEILAAAPDLTVSEVEVPDSLIIGETFNLNWGVDNTGATTSTVSDWNDRVYISDDAVFDEDEDTELATFSADSKTPIASGASYQHESANLTFPNVKTGSRYLLFVTDADENQLEVDETNNVKAVPIEITAPNLEITNTVVSESASLNETIDLEWTVKNTGSAKTTPSTWYDRIYLSNDEIYDNDDEQLASSQNSYSSGNTPIFAGKDYTSDTKIIIPNTETGSRFLLFVTDEGEAQGELNESDNVVSVPIELVAPDVDLAIAGTSVPEAVSPNQDDVSISWTVKNGSTVIPVVNTTDSVVAKKMNALG